MENTDRRNPYLILGLPYGSTRAEATKALARRSRAARRIPDFPFSMEDLTWALNQIEAQIENPESSLDTYRVPADPTVLEVPPGPGILRPPPRPIERQTVEPTQSEIQAVTDIVDAEVERQMFSAVAEKMRELIEVNPGQMTARFAPKAAPRRRKGLFGL
jgi:hypothetical protein